MQLRRSTLVYYLLAAWTAQCRHLQSRALTQVRACTAQLVQRSTDGVYALRHGCPTV